MKRFLLLFFGLFVPGAALTIFLTGEWGDAPNFLETTTAPPAQTAGSFNTGADHEIVQLADRITVVEPEVRDFTFPVREEFLIHSEEFMVKTGELQGKKLDFADGGNLVNVTSPLIILYQKIDPATFDGRLEDVELVPIAEARAERGTLDQTNNVARLMGSVEIQHFEKGRLVARLDTDSVVCHLKEQVLTTEDPVRMLHTLARSKSTDPSKKPGTLELSGRGLDADLLKRDYRIHHEPKILYKSTDLALPMTFAARGVLHLQELGEDTGSRDPREDQLMVSRARITLTEEVTIDLPASFGGSKNETVPRIEAGKVVLFVENLSQDGDQKVLGRSIKTFDAEGEVRVISDEILSRSETLHVTRGDDGKFHLLAEGRPKMLLTPKDGTQGEGEETDPFSIRSADERTVVLSADRKIEILGVEKQVPETEPGGGSLIVFERIDLDGKAIIKRKPREGEEEPEGLRGDAITVELDRGEDDRLWVRRIFSRSEASLFDATTRIWGDEIEAFPPPATKGLRFGPLTTRGRSGFQTPMRGGFVPESGEEKPSLLTITCKDGIEYVPRAKTDADPETHEATFRGDVLVQQTDLETEALLAKMTTKELALDLVRDPSVTDEEERPRFVLEEARARQHVLIEREGLRIRGAGLRVRTDPTWFSLHGKPALFEETNPDGSLARRLVAQKMVYRGDQEQFTAQNEVEGFFLVDDRGADDLLGTSSKKEGPEGTPEPEGEPSRSAIQIRATDLVATFRAPTGSEGTDPPVEVPEQLQTLHAEGGVELLRYETESLLTDPIRLVGQSLDYDDDEQLVIVHGTEEDPAMILHPSDADPARIDELKGPILRYARGRAGEPDRILLQDGGLVRLHTTAGESFYATDKLEPRTESTGDGEPVALDTGAAGDVDPSEPEQISLTQVRCRGPMELIRGRFLRFEEDVVVKRYQPLDTLQATTTCDLLTLYFETPPASAAEGEEADGEVLEKVSRVIALGNVRFKGNGREGMGSKLVWIPGENLISLKGEDAPARLKIRFKNGQVMTRQAPFIEYNFKTDHLRAHQPRTKIRSTNKGTTSRN